MENILSYGFLVVFIVGSVSMGLRSRILFGLITQGLKIEKVEIRVLPTRPVLPPKDEKLSAECTQSKLVKIT